MKHATAYFTRDNVEYEVTGELVEHGVLEVEQNHFGGACNIVVDDPVFFNFECYNDEGVKIALTNKEFHLCHDQMVDEYWNTCQTGDIYMGER